MARLPVVNSQVQFNTGRGSTPNPTRDTAIGQGLQQFGAGIQDLGAVLIRRKQEMENFRAQAAYIQFQGERQQALLDRTQNITPGGDAFTSTTLDDFNTAANTFIESLPESVRPEFYTRVLADRNGVADQATRIEFQERTRYFTDSVNQAGTAIGQRVMMSPNDLSAAITEIDRLIMATSLGDVEKQQLMQQWHTQLAESQITGLIQQDPASAYIALGGTAPPGNLALGLSTEARTAVLEASAATGINPNYLAMTLGTEGGAAARNLPLQPVQPAGQTMTAENFRSQYYTPADFQSHDGAPLAMDPNAVAALDNMTRSLGGIPLTITSAHRSAERNGEVDGAQNSQHLHGTAFDIQLPADPNERRRILTAAIQAGFTGFGFYAETPNMLHIDTRGTSAVWYWGGGGATTPEWAAPVWNEYTAQRQALDNVQPIVNPDSSARGPYQFIDDTWLQLITENGAKYGVNIAGMDRDQLLGLRDDFRLSTLMAAEYAADNRLYMMEQLNRDVTLQEVYLAHFMGPGGAVNLIKAAGIDPNHDATELFPAAAAANRSIFYNQDGSHRSVTDVYNEVVRRFDAQAISNQPSQGQISPAYSGIATDRIASFQNQAAAAVNDQLQAQANAETNRMREQQALYTNRVSSVERQIYDDPTYGHADLVGEGLQDADYVRLARQIDARDADTNALRDAMARFQDPNSRYSVYSEDDRNEVDRLYQAFDPENEQLLGLTTTGADGLVEMVSRTGIIPESAASQLMAMSRSGNPAEMAYALTLGARIYEANPDALYGTGFSEQLLPDIARWNNLTVNQGMDYTAAANRMIEDRVPMTRERLSMLSEQADAFTATLTLPEIQNYFDNRYGDVFGLPAAGFTPEAGAALLSEYQTFAREAFLHEANGDPNVARTLAQAHMDQLYGVTRIFGAPTIMRHPPERTYGNVGDSMEWFGQQLEYEVEAAVGQDVDRRDIVLYTYSQTERDIQNGEAPRYAMGVWTDRDGQRIFEWLPMAFTPNMGYAQSVQDQIDERNFRTGQSQNQIDPAVERYFAELPPGTPYGQVEFRMALARETAVGGAPTTQPRDINYVPYELQARRADALGLQRPNGLLQFPPIDVQQAPPITLRREGAPGADEPAFMLPQNYESPTTRTVRETEPLDRGYTVMPGSSAVNLRRDAQAQPEPTLRTGEGGPAPIQAPPGVVGMPQVTEPAPAPPAREPPTPIVNNEREPSVPVPGSGVSNPDEQAPPSPGEVIGRPLNSEASELVSAELEGSILENVPEPTELPTAPEQIDAATLPLPETVEILTDMRRQDFEDTLRYVQQNNADPNVNNIDYTVRLLAERFNKTEEQVTQWIQFMYGGQQEQGPAAPPPEDVRTPGEGPGANVRPTDLVPENLPVPAEVQSLADMGRDNAIAILEFVRANKPATSALSVEDLAVRLLMVRFNTTEELARNWLHNMLPG